MIVPYSRVISNAGAILEQRRQSPTTLAVAFWSPHDIKSDIVIVRQNGDSTKMMSLQCLQSRLNSISETPVMVPEWHPFERLKQRWNDA